MSASNEWTEWHLTPGGWLRGSEKEDSGGTKLVPKPDQCVMTVRHREYLSSSFSKLEKTDETVWASEDDSIVEGLLGQHGQAPKHL
jgi:hypothetical protein